MNQTIVQRVIQILAIVEGSNLDFFIISKANTGVEGTCDCFIFFSTTVGFEAIHVLLHGK
jgi:hypothetical protein